MPEAPPKAPPAQPATEPKPAPARPAPAPRPDPFNPPWPQRREVPEPKARNATDETRRN